MLRSSFQQLLDGREYTVGGNSRTVKARIGAELLTPGALTADEVLARARATARGNNPVAADHLDEAGEPTPVMPVNNPSERLRLALEQARFVMLVQPVVALANLPADALPAPLAHGLQCRAGPARRSLARPARARRQSPPRNR